jgi:hypothetical protein
MPQPITFNTVREIALGLPGAADGMSYGAPAVKVNGKLFIRWREDLNAIVLKTTFEEREAMMDEDPKVYFITDHYLNYEWVLVSLEHVSPDVLPDLIKPSYDLARKGKK